MVESIYFLKPAWCGNHPAGLWPEQGLQPVTTATAFRRWFLTERRLARQLLHPLHFDAAIRATHPVQLHHHRRVELKTRQISDRPFIDFVNLPDTMPAARAHQLPVAPLPAHP